MRTPIILSCLLALAAPAAAAESIRGISASYNVDVGSMTMMVVRFGSSFEGGAMRSEAVIKSKGLSAVFSEYSARAEAEGRLGGQAIEPALFRLSRDKDGRKKKTTVQWDDGGAITTEPPVHKKPEKRAKVESALTPDVSDPITAIFKVGASGENPCGAAVRVFDGRDVFDLTLSDAAARKRKNKDGYRGPVRNCEVRWRAIAGRSAEKGEPDGVYGVSFAPVGTLESGQTLWFPVALNGKVKGLEFEVNVTKLRVDGGQAAEQLTQD